MTRPSGPELREQISRHDLFAPDFELSCLNRLQLRNNQQMRGLTDPSGGLQMAGRLVNPPARFAYGGSLDRQDEPSAFYTALMNRQFLSLLERARRLGGSRTAPVVIGVAGVPGAGKTTLVESLVGELNKGVPDPEHQRFAHVPMDGFHLSDLELTRLGLLDRKGAPETFDVHGYAATLHRLRTPRAVVVYAPGFERTLEQPIAGVIPVYPSATTILTEGNYLLLDSPGWRQVRDQCTEIWYCEQDSELRIRRLIQRHIQYGKSPADAEWWVRTVDEKNARLIESFRAGADLVVTLPENVFGQSGGPIG